jgi:hypothetical protein
MHAVFGALLLESAPLSLRDSNWDEMRVNFYAVDSLITNTAGIF